ncbi:MAG TPA: membrane protein insertase YidC [Oceanospirillales bacterium]|nr:membrane protein insertase YidC [Oceanospirillales bacterium]
MKKTNILLLFLTLPLFAQNNSITTIIDEQIVEKTPFYGLASYYNNVNYFILDEALTAVEANVQTTLNNKQKLVAVGRFKVLVVKADKLVFSLSEQGQITIENPSSQQLTSSQLQVYSKPELAKISPQYDLIRYSHLWAPLAWLAKAMEASLVFVHKNLVSNWGWAIIVFGVLLKLLLIPAGLLTTKFQRRVSQVKTALEPKLAAIKSKYDGEQAHHKIMAAHKELGVSPFYTLKPLLGSFIQIPILIAVFNALGEMPQLQGQSFLWIKDLAYPDSLAVFDFGLPMFGHSLNLLPFIMTIVTIFSTIIFKNKFATTRELKGQKTNLYLMAFAFFVLFYPFPAAMVLYWVLANILQTIQQQIIKI